MTTNAICDIIIEEISRELHRVFAYSMKIFCFIGGVGILIEEIISRYKKFMTEHYSNQGEAAEDLKISRSHLNKIINRRDNPSTTLLIRMEKIMEEYSGK